MISSVMAARTPAEIDRPHRRPTAQIQLVTSQLPWSYVLPARILRQRKTEARQHGARRDDVAVQPQLERAQAERQTDELREMKDRQARFGISAPPRRQGLVAVE